RAMSGVKSAVAINMIPFGRSSWDTGISLVSHEDPNAVNVGMFFGGQDLLKTLGAQLIAGRDFTPEEHVHYQAARQKSGHLPSVIITRATAERLFPGTSAVGKLAYVWSKDPQTIVGVIERIARPNDINSDESSEFSMLLPVKAPYTVAGNYLLRVDPTRKAE